FQKAAHDGCARIKMTLEDPAKRLYHFGRIIFQPYISVRASAKGALDRQWIFACRDHKNSSSPIQSPKILDQFDAASATKRHTKCYQPWLMSNKHFAARRHIIRFTADSKAACRFNQCNQPRADERCMMDDEHLSHCGEFHRGINRGFCPGRPLRP